MTAVSSNTSTTPNSSTDFFSGLFDSADAQAIGGTFRDRFGESLFKSNSRKRQYIEADMAKVNMHNIGALNRINESHFDNTEDRLALQMTGADTKLSAKTVDQQFSPMAGNNFRMAMPIRA